MSRRLRAFWLALVLLLPAAVLAHNPDTSYVRCAVADDRVEVRLIYDVFTLLKMSDLDADHDQRLTRVELRKGAPAIQSFLRAHVIVEIDRQSGDLGEALDPVWPDADAGSDGIAASEWHAASSLITFPFRRRVPAAPGEVALTFTFFPELGARHTVLGVFERAGRSQEVTFTDSEPDYLFDIGYEATPTTPKETISAALKRFLRLGVEHIFLGPDHLCFLLALIVVGRLKELIKVITSFTVAHTITLILAALKIVTLPPRFIECGVALTIVYVAVENLWRKEVAHRWVLTFVFGLIHGFSFANTLSALGLPREATIRCLLTFNVGVELAQVMIVLLVFPLVMMLGKSRHAIAGRAFVNCAIGLFGLGWLIDRAFSLRLMPF